MKEEVVEVVKVFQELIGVVYNRVEVIVVEVVQLHLECIL